MYGFAYKILCEIDRVGLNAQLSSLNNLSLKEFNHIESLFFWTFNCNISVSEERFSNKIATLEKLAAEESAVQVLCTDSIDSISSNDISSVTSSNAEQAKPQEKE